MLFVSLITSVPSEVSTKLDKLYQRALHRTCLTSIATIIFVVLLPFEIWKERVPVQSSFKWEEKQLFTVKFNDVVDKLVLEISFNHVKECVDF